MSREKDLLNGAVSWLFEVYYKDYEVIAYALSSWGFNEDEIRAEFEIADFEEEAIEDLLRLVREV